MDYPLTKKQQATLDKAVALLLPFSKESVSQWTGYFEEQDEDGDRIGDNDFSDYDTCDNDDCLNHNWDILKKNLPSLNIQFRWYSNDGDHDKYDHCTVCGRPLNEFLTWINDEIDNHIEYTTTKQLLIDSSAAFEINGCFVSMGWNADERMSIHASTHHHENGVKRQKLFIKKVVDYANLIIKLLS